MSPSLHTLIFSFCLIIISSGLVSGKNSSMQSQQVFSETQTQTHTYQSVFVNVAVGVLLTEPAHSMPHVSHILSCV